MILQVFGFCLIVDERLSYISPPLSAYNLGHIHKDHVFDRNQSLLPYMVKTIKY